MLSAHLCESPRSHTQSGGLGVHVSECHVGCPNIGANDVYNAVYGIVTLIQLYARELQPFLEYLRRICRPAPGIFATKLGPMSLVGREGSQFAVYEERHNHGHIR